MPAFLAAYLAAVDVRLLALVFGRVIDSGKMLRNFVQIIKVRGIVGNTKRTPLDECGHVYKNLDEVLAVLEGEGIAKVAHRMFPVANLKGTD